MLFSLQAEFPSGITPAIKPCREKTIGKLQWLNNEHRLFSAFAD